MQQKNNNGILIQYLGGDILYQKGTGKYIVENNFQEDIITLDELTFSKLEDACSFINIVIQGNANPEKCNAKFLIYKQEVK